MKTYASLALLKQRLGVTSTDSDDVLALSLVQATRALDAFVGNGAEADDAWTGDADDLEVVDEPAAAFVNATLYLAVRFHKTPDVPFGLAGMNDAGLVAYVRRSAPELELMLHGQRLQWGIA